MDRLIMKSVFQKLFTAKPSKPIHEEYPEILEWKPGDKISVKNYDLRHILFGEWIDSCVYVGTLTNGVVVSAVKNKVKMSRLVGVKSIYGLYNESLKLRKEKENTSRLGFDVEMSQYNLFVNLAREQNQLLYTQMLGEVNGNN